MSERGSSVRGRRCEDKVALPHAGRAFRNGQEQQAAHRGGGWEIVVDLLQDLHAKQQLEHLVLSIPRTHRAAAPSCLSCCLISGLHQQQAVPFQACTNPIYH